MKFNYYLIVALSILILDSCTSYKYKNLSELTIKNGKYYYNDNVYTGETSIIKEDSSHLEIFEGILILKTIYKNGLKNGIEESYDRKTGKLVTSRLYVNDKLEGDAFEYKNGILYSKVTYVNGKREGVNYIYKEDGTVASKFHYKNDELIVDYKVIIKDSIYINIIDLISQKPLLTCDPCSDRPNSRGKSIEIGKANGIQTLTAEGANRSGNFGGPSLITIYADTANRKVNFASNNTTGSIYTGYEQWDDTYPIDLTNVFIYEEENKYGIGFSRNKRSERGTTDYTVNITYFPKEGRIAFIVFGGDSWEQSASFYFKDTKKTKLIMDKLIQLGKELG